MKTALLVVDVQRALCVGDSATVDAERVISRINGVIAKVRSSERPVIFVQHEAAEGAFVQGSEGWRLADGLESRDSDIFIRKSASDSFHNTELQERLQAHGVDHLIVCGMQSEFCVDSTIRRALALGYPVTVVADGHTTMDNPVLSADLISRHHNYTWSDLTSYGPRATPVPAHEVQIPA
jgi:nicotinamidase-related amidase